MRGDLRQAPRRLPLRAARESQGECQLSGRLVAGAQQGAELHDQVQERGPHRGAVECVPAGEPLADGDCGRELARDDRAGVTASRPLGRLASRAAAEEALRGGGGDRGQQSHAVHAVVPEDLALAWADAVQGLHRERPEPVRGLVRGHQQDATGLVDLCRGGGRDRDARAYPDTQVHSQQGHRPHPHPLTEASGAEAVVAQRPLQLDQSGPGRDGLDHRGDI
ncbi:hypothetical protein ABZT03_29355, partial [Streptomyces sp. NPDC005574]|uniref:hypothetical protein n=1 Tax=Streptomyces sp. NPDC005574 TaxID=3156891 RepID=UPI00339E583D